MSTGLLADAFAHHIWATGVLLDACLELPSEQLEAPVPGVYGSILATMRHLVAADAGYLVALTAGKEAPVDTSEMGLAELRPVIEHNGLAWDRLLSEELDPDEVVVRKRPDGSETHAPVGLRLAQAIHHGTDHRSQICTALTGLGVEPPDIDLWMFGLRDGRVLEIEPTA
jgi:uncharacterized damage-inducible protein DinB